MDSDSQWQQQGAYLLIGVTGCFAGVAGLKGPRGLREPEGLPTCCCWGLRVLLLLLLAADLLMPANVLGSNSRRFTCTSQLQQQRTQQRQ